MIRCFASILIASGLFAAPQAPGTPQSKPVAMRLEDLERMALGANPVLKQAVAQIRAAEGRRRQVGLYPNPVVGYTGDEVSTGPIIGGGEHGAFLEQRIVTGGKLGLARRVADQDVQQARAFADMARQRVLNTVRALFYQALGEQRLVEVRTQLSLLARRAVTATSELANVGQADRPDLLAVEIEAERLGLGLVTARNALDRTWRQLSAVTGNPSLTRTVLEGNIEELPKLDFEQALAGIYKASPELRAAEIGVTRSEVGVRFAQRSAVPDVIARVGAHYNRERLELNQQRVGWQSSAELGVALPIFNRNQGAVAEARAEVERAQSETERVKLNLRARLASSFREYQDSLAAIERYKNVMLPRAEKAYQMYLVSFRQMAAAYPQVIITQRNLFQLQEDYVASLIGAWQRVVEIQGLLISADAAPEAARLPVWRGAQETVEE